MLVTSIVLLVLGVLCSQWFRSQPNWSIILEGYVAVFVGGVILLELLPHCFESLGAIAVLWVVLGLAMMGISELWVGRFGAEQNSPAAGWSMDTVFRVLSLICGFGVHAIADGSALAVGELRDAVSSSGGVMLMLAVVAHRLPIGIALGLLVVNRRHLFLVTMLLVVCTMLGYFSTYLAQVHSSDLSDLAVLQAVACGSLMHVVFGHPINERVIPRLRALGASVSVVCLGILLFTSEHTHSPLTLDGDSVPVSHHSRVHDHDHDSSTSSVDLAHHSSATELRQTSAALSRPTPTHSLLKLLWWLASFALLAVLAFRPIRILCFGEHNLSMEKNSSRLT